MKNAVMPIDLQISIDYVADLLNQQYSMSELLDARYYCHVGWFRVALFRLVVIDFLVIHYLVTIT